MLVYTQEKQKVRQAAMARLKHERDEQLAEQAARKAQDLARKKMEEKDARNQAVAEQKAKMKELEAEKQRRAGTYLNFSSFSISFLSPCMIDPANKLINNRDIVLFLEIFNSWLLAFCSFIPLFIYSVNDSFTHTRLYL